MAEIVVREMREEDIDGIMEIERDKCEAQPDRQAYGDYQRVAHTAEGGQVMPVEHVADTVGERYPRHAVQHAGGQGDLRGVAYPEDEAGAGYDGRNRAAGDYGYTVVYPVFWEYGFEEKAVQRGHEHYEYGNPVSSEKFAE